MNKIMETCFKYVANLSGFLSTGIKSSLSSSGPNLVRFRKNDFFVKILFNAFEDFVTKLIKVVHI